MGHDLCTLPYTLLQNLNNIIKNYRQMCIVCVIKLYTNHLE